MADPQTTSANRRRNFSEKCVERFDELISEGEIKYEVSTVTIHSTGSDFQISFRYTPWLQAKPVIDPEEPSEARNPFLTPDRRFIVLWPDLDRAARATHRVLINKYPVYRPQLLLTTIESKSQADNLDGADFTAVRTVLEQLSVHDDPSGNSFSENSAPSEWLAIYNCGRHSGNSQPHKHLQVFPIPDSDQGADIVLFPERENVKSHLQELTVPTSQNSSRKCYADRRVPYVHFLSYFDGKVDGAKSAEKIPSTDEFGETYGMLLSLGVRACAKTNVPPPASYNLLLTRRWMLLIPRRASCGKDTGSPEQGPMVNSMGMAGMVWLSRKDDEQEWLNRGLEEHLEVCGLAWKEAEVDWE